MSSSRSTTRLYAEESTGKHLANIKVESVKSNRLALPKLLFTSPGPLPKGNYHFAHCEMGRGILTSFHTLKDNKYGELLLTWKDKQPLPINVAASTVIDAVEGAFQGAFAGILFHTAIQACVGSQAASLLLRGGPWVLARNWGSMVAVEFGLLSIMTPIGGPPGFMSGLVAGSGDGLTISLLLGEPPIVALATSLCFAAVGGITVKVLVEAFTIVWRRFVEKFQDMPLFKNCHCHFF